MLPPWGKEGALARVSEKEHIVASLACKSATRLLSWRGTPVDSAENGVFPPPARKAATQFDGGSLTGLQQRLVKTGGRLLPLTADQVKKRRATRMGKS
jgi:hypothetical protein